MISAATAKETSEEWLRARNIKVNPALPELDPSSELSPRSAEEVAKRAWILSVVIMLGYDMDSAVLKGWLERRGLADGLTPDELDLLSGRDLTKIEREEVAWHCDSVCALMWALGRGDLDPLGSCPDEQADSFKPGLDPNDLIESAVLRDYDSIYSMADLHYRLHWAVIDAQLGRRDPPMREIVVANRRRALDWVIGVQFPWDEIPLDT